MEKKQGAKDVPSIEEIWERTQRLEAQLAQVAAGEPQPRRLSRAGWLKAAAGAVALAGADLMSRPSPALASDGQPINAGALNTQTSPTILQAQSGFTGGTLGSATVSAVLDLDANTAVNGSVNINGFEGHGSGSGAGGTGYGGNSNGAGLSGQGGGTSGNGVTGFGASGGSGIAGYGGSDNASGVYGQGGGATGPGVIGTGTTGMAGVTQATDGLGIMGQALVYNSGTGSFSTGPGYGGLFEGGRGAIVLIPASTAGPPPALGSGTYRQGAVYLDSNAKLWVATQNSSSGGFMPLNSLIPLTQPTRVLDTRFNTGGYSGEQAPGSKLTLTLSSGAINGTPVNLLVNGQSVPVPDSAVALIGTLRATQPQGDGYLTAYPGNGSQPTASNVNYVSSADPSYAISDEVTVGLQNKQMSIYVGGLGPTQIVFDVSAAVI